MKKFLAGVAALMMCTTSLAYATTSTPVITDSELSALSSILEKEYNAYPVLSKYCGPYQGLNPDNITTATKDFLPEDFGCGKYNAIAERALTDFQKKIDVKATSLGATAKRLLEQGKLQGVKEVMSYSFRQLTSFGKASYSTALRARNLLIKQKRLQEAKDFQSAMTLFIRKSLIVLSPYVEKATMAEFK